MKRVYFIQIVLTLIAFVALNSCVSESNDNETEEIDTLVEEEMDDNQFSYLDDPNTVIKIPSPFELYRYMQVNNVIFDARLLNPVENIEKYYTAKSKAINFGIYASDLAYTSVYNENQKTFFYSKNVKKLADAIGLTEGFDASMVERVSDNINNADSLYNITSEAYMDACNFLEDQGKEDLLAYIIVGGWLESVHIAINSVKEFDTESNLIRRIADQRLSLESLIEHVSIKADSEEMNELLEKLLILRETFDKIYNSDSETIKEEHFNEISTQIESLRNKFTN